MKGNVVDMAVGVIIGAAFGKIVSSLVENVIMPPLGMALSGIDFADGPYAAAEGADALAICTEWDAFRALDLRRMAGLLREPLLVDLRNVYQHAEAEAAGLRYVGIGKRA